MTTHGRDISAYDSNVNYHGYDFIIGKFTEGASFVSPGAVARAHATRAAGKVFGAYHFAQPGNGAQQADRLLSVEIPKKGDLPGVLDYEVNGLGIPFLKAFSNRYHSRIGVWPTVYASLSRYRDELKSGAGWRQPGQLLWIARYGASNPGTTCNIWQYQGGPDLDLAYTPLSQMIIGGAAAPGVKPVSPWRSRYNVDSTSWVPGRAPVYALPKTPYTITTQPKTVDARRVPADRCPNGANGPITAGWADFLYDLLAALPFDDRPGATFAAHFGVKRDGKYGSAHAHALDEYSARHNLPKWSTPDAGNKTLGWASLLDQVRA